MDNAIKMKIVAFQLDLITEKLEGMRQTSSTEQFSENKSLTHRSYCINTIDKHIKFPSPYEHALIEKEIY